VPIRPTLIVVSGMPGAGKTTLAHRLAAAIGCPAICRDEIKEGMVLNAPDFNPGQDDALSRAANATFSPSWRPRHPALTPRTARPLR
jgi:predicted kinase